MVAEMGREVSLVIGMPVSGGGANGVRVDADEELLKVQEVARDLAARLLAEEEDGHEQKVARPCVWREGEGWARLSFACGPDGGNGASGRAIAAGERALEIVSAALAAGKQGRLHGELPVDLAVRLSRAWWMAGEDALLSVCRDGEEAVVLDGAERKAYRLAATLEDAKDAATLADWGRLIEKHFGDVPAKVWDECEPVDLVPADGRVEA